jgi:hypothetical protein
MNTKTILLIALSLALLLAACGPDPNAPRVFFTNIEDGATVKSPVLLQWGAQNFTIEPAGEVHPNAGHLHVIINNPCVPAGEIVPQDVMYLHFGKAQMEIELGLQPGEYTLCLQAADGAHTALAGDGMTQVIEITVEE